MWSEAMLLRSAHLLTFYSLEQLRLLRKQLERDLNKRAEKGEWSFRVCVCVVVFFLIITPTVDAQMAILKN